MRTALFVYSRYCKDDKLRAHYLGEYGVLCNFLEFKRKECQIDKVIEAMEEQKILSLTNL